MKHIIMNGMIMNPIVSAEDLSQNSVQMGTMSANNKENNEP